MKLAISNIAWSVQEEDAIAARLVAWGAQGVEVAPTRIWHDLSRAPAAEVTAYKRYWRDHGLEIPSMQALLFGQPALRLFQGPETREQMLAYLDHALRIGALLGARVLVFGSPKNRQRGPLGLVEARQVAFDFFGRLGDRACNHGVTIGLEANPTDYHCDFLTTHQELADFVQALDHPGVVHHLDLGGVILSQEHPRDAVKALWPLAHVHLSEPFLNGLGQHQEAHERLARTLLRRGYEGWVSIETRSDETDPAGRVQATLAFARARYQGTMQLPA